MKKFLSIMINPASGLPTFSETAVSFVRRAGEKPRRGVLTARTPEAVLAYGSYFCVVTCVE